MPMDSHFSCESHSLPFSFWTQMNVPHLSWPAYSASFGSFCSCCPTSVKTGWSIPAALPIDTTKHQATLPITVTAAAIVTLIAASLRLVRKVENVLNWLWKSHKSVITRVKILVGFPQTIPEETEGWMDLNHSSKHTATCLPASPV